MWIIDSISSYLKAAFIELKIKRFIELNSVKQC